MALTETVRIDERGRVTRSKKKLRGRKIDRKTKELRRFTRKKLQNMTKSDKHFDYGVFKNSHVMSAQTKNPRQHTYEHDLHGERVNYPYDSRCHPHFKV